jgi:hypothetical protein
MINGSKRILINSGRIWDLEGNVDLPAERTVIVKDGRVASVSEPDAISEIARSRRR